MDASATQETDPKFLAFKAELDALLLKYSAHLWGAYEGDTYGIEAESFGVCLDSPRPSGSVRSSTSFTLNPTALCYPT